MYLTYPEQTEITVARQSKNLTWFHNEIIQIIPQLIINLQNYNFY